MEHCHGIFHSRDAAHALEEPIPIVGYVRKPVEFGMLIMHVFAVFAVVH